MRLIFLVLIVIAVVALVLVGATQHRDQPLSASPQVSLFNSEHSEVYSPPNPGDYSEEDYRRHQARLAAGLAEGVPVGVSDSSGD